MQQQQQQQQAPQQQQQQQQQQHQFPHHQLTSTHGHFSSQPIQQQLIQTAQPQYIQAKLSSDRRMSEQALRPVQTVRLGSAQPLQQQTVALVRSPKQLVYVQQQQQQPQPVQQQAPQQIQTQQVIQTQPAQQVIVVPSSSPQRIVKQQYVTKTIQVVQQTPVTITTVPVKTSEPEECKKCPGLEATIYQLQQSGNSSKITEIHLEETLVENRNLIQQNNELNQQIQHLKQQMDQLHLRLNQLSLFETEYGKIQDHYNQQVNYVDQLKNELANKNNTIQELLAKDDMNKKNIDELNRLIDEMRDHQDDQVKRNKQQKQNADKEKEDKNNEMLSKLQEKDNEIQNILFLLSNAENAKQQWEIQLQNMNAQLQALNSELRFKDEQLSSKNAENERLRDQINQLQLTILNLQSVELEKNRLLQMLESKNAEIEHWKAQNQQLLAAIEDLRAQNSKIYELENKIVMLSMELERLRAMNDSKDEEVKRSRNRQGELEKDSEDKRGLLVQLGQLESRLNMYKNELEQTSRALEAKTKEADELRLQLNQLSHLQFTVQQNESIIQNLSQKINLLEVELRSARENVFNLEVENNNLKKQLQDASLQISAHSNEISQLKSLTSDYHSVRQSVSEQEYKVIQLTQNISNLTLIIQQKETEVEQWRNQWKLVCEENERIKKTVNEQNGALRQLEVNLHEMSLQLDTLKDLQALCNDLRAQNELLRNQLLQQEMKYEDLARKYAAEKEQLENKIAMISMENQRKDYMLQARDKDLESLRTQLVQFTDIQIQFRQNQDKINYLLGEIERLQTDRTQLIKEAEQWRVRYTEISHYEFKVRDLLERYVLACAEIETLRGGASTSNNKSSIKGDASQTSSARASQQITSQSPLVQSITTTTYTSQPVQSYQPYLTQPVTSYFTQQSPISSYSVQSQSQQQQQQTTNQFQNYQPYKY